MSKRRFTQRSISIAVAEVFGTSLTLALCGQTALAQNTVERVQVTGSNIPRAQSETASPVLVISRDDIERSGKATVAEYLQSLSIDGQGSVPTSFGLGFAAGGTGVSLRGLGAGSTLVLLNGRRMAPFGLADDGQKIFTDLSTIPVEIIERIEILKDGASSIYGSDAIAGVVNVITRSSFNGTVLRATAGTSRYTDGNHGKLSLTSGFGDLDADGYNAYFNFEASKSSAIFYRDRDRAWVGRSDLRPWGYDQFAGGLPLGGAITDGGAFAFSSPVGSVRDPATGLYSSLPGCARYSSVTPTDPGGGCLWDRRQYQMLQPERATYNLMGRGTWRIGGDFEAYAEAQYVKTTSYFETTPSGVSGAWGYPGGPVNASSGPGATVLAPSHPDNPFGGAAARLRYLAADVGPRTSDVNNQFTRFAAGVRGRLGAWDFDSALVYSATDLENVYNGYLRYSTTRAALGDPNSPLFPYRIGVNSGLNPASLYAAISPTLRSNAKSSMSSIDVKAVRELTQLPGGPMSVAVGAEYRREESKLTPTTYTDTGDIIGLGYSAYDGSRNVAAAYAEVLAPVLTVLDLNAAVRTDQYSRIGNSTTPKVGFKFTPLPQIALRGTYAEGFRAPNAAESGTGGLAAYTNAADPVRCPGGTPAAGATTADCSTPVASITSGNSELKPERSRGTSLGVIWSPMPTTSLSVDAWQIRRTNEINQQTVAQALDAGTSVVRDSNNLPGIPNSGTLLAVRSPFINSSRTDVRGVDVEFRQRWNLEEAGRVTVEVRWTHLGSFMRTDPDGTELQFAGTHGNCDVTNCAGTPKNKVNAVVSWDKGDWRWTALANWRGPMANVFSAGEPCVTHFASGADAPDGCKISSFYTVDLSARWRARKDLEIFGSIQNLFDKIAPIDPTSYGGIGFNPMDISGAIGRYVYVGARYKFN
jgi:iron complex outermembrane receptor protein